MLPACFKLVLLALFLLCLSMFKSNATSRRMFIMALCSSSVCHAVTPLINFDKSNGALIDIDTNGSLFGSGRDFNLAEDPYSLFDVEPDLTTIEAASRLKKNKFRYKPKRDFWINLHNVNNNEKLSHMVTRFDSGIGYYNSRLDYFFFTLNLLKLFKTIGTEYLMGRSILAIFFLKNSCLLKRSALLILSGLYILQ